MGIEHTENLQSRSRKRKPLGKNSAERSPKTEFKEHKLPSANLEQKRSEERQGNVHLIEHDRERSNPRACDEDVEIIDQRRNMEIGIYTNVGPESSSMDGYLSPLA